jgi:Fe2+ or Zn2+ uptake regulation protein
VSNIGKRCEEHDLVVESESELVAAWLRDAGLRVTLPRRAVLSLIIASEEHLTAEQVRDALSRQGVGLPRSSINNILGNLARRGVVGRVATLPGPARFEADCSAHDHYWCSGCGLIVNVPSRRRRSAIPPLPGTVTVETTTYIGECRHCQQSEAIDTSRSSIPESN